MIAPNTAARQSTWVCVGNGPSLKDVDLESVRGRAGVIVINDGILKAPWADILYFADGRWYEWRKPLYTPSGWQFHWRDGRTVVFAGEIHTIDEICGRRHEWKWYRNIGIDGFDDREDCLRGGLNSGYQAVQVAYKQGAKKILLVGYDHRTTGGHHQWHGGYRVKTSDGFYRRCLTKWPLLAEAMKERGVDVVNCTPRSALDVFRHGDLECELSA